MLNGLDGYSGVLVALALGTVFLGADARRVPVTLVGVALTVPVRWLMIHTVIPVYTWPFILVTWAMLWIVRRRPALTTSRTSIAAEFPGHHN